MCLDLGMSKSTLSDLKSGRKKSFTAETAQKIASYLGVSVAYLLGEEEKEQPAILGELSDDKIKLIKRLDHLSEEKIRLLLQVAESLE